MRSQRHHDAEAEPFGPKARYTLAAKEQEHGSAEMKKKKFKKIKQQPCIAFLHDTQDQAMCTWSENSSEAFPCTRQQSFRRYDRFPSAMQSSCRPKSGHPTQLQEDFPREKDFEKGVSKKSFLLKNILLLTLSPLLEV